MSAKSPSHSSALTIRFFSVHSKTFTGCLSIYLGLLKFIPAMFYCFYYTVLVKFIPKEIIMFNATVHGFVFGLFIASV